MLNRKNLLANYNAFNDMAQMERRFFEDPFEFFKNSGLTEFKTDIKDEGDKYVLQADLPGFSKEDIKLDVEDNILSISAERHSEHEEKDKKGKFVCCERSYGSYRRQFDITGVRTEDIKARYENGVLELDMPKKTAGADGKQHLAIE